MAKIRSLFDTDDTVIMMDENVNDTEKTIQDPIQMIFDTETTGLDEEDRIIQVGAIVTYLKDSAYSKVFDELCRTKDDIPIKIEAMATHGIREEQIKGKSLFSETDFIKILNELNNEDNYLIAHNLSFDLNMLEKEGFDNKFKLIDTLQCAKHLFEIGDIINGYKVSNYKLQTFRYMMFSQQEEDVEANKYGVEIKAHDAIGDVVILKMFLNQLREKVREKYKIEDPITVMNKMVELTNEPAEVKIINFGKHKGKTVSEIESIDPGWLSWLYKEQKKQKDNNDPKYNNDLFHTLEKVVGSRSKKTAQSIDF